MYYGKVEISGINTSKLRVLSEEEKSELLEKTAKGDMKAREELINGNLRLVLSVIQKFTGRGESPDDLFQVGVIGLIKAIDNFSAEFGVKFSTYAVPTVYISRNTCKKGSQTMTIKRQKAFDIAISAIKAQPESEENLAAIEYLEAARNERYIRWTEEKIFESFENWVKKNGRYPRVSDLHCPELPSPGTIKSVIKMSAGDFLVKYYPSEPERKLHRYAGRTKEEWIADFIEQYNEIRPTSADEYDAKRKPGTPSHVTVARYAGLATWFELIEFTKVDKSCLARKFRMRSEPVQYTLVTENSLLERYEKLARELADMRKAETAPEREKLRNKGKRK